MSPNSLQNICVWLVDDNEQFCFILTESFKEHNEIRCTRIFKNGELMLDALTEADDLPRVILLDINMPGITGLEVLAQIKILAPEIRVVMLTVNFQDTSIKRAIELGASGYLLKSSTIDDVVKAIKTVLEGGITINPFIMEKVFKIFSINTNNVSRYRLSEREKEIIQIISEGLTTKETGERMNLSQHTIHAYLKRIFQKLDVHTRHELVAKALKEKLI